jgi:tRNA threonylcarbamoyladenosine biosynthesis protein TsaB
MIVLSIDTSADLISVALLRDHEPLAERSWHASRPRSEGALQVVEGVLTDAGVALSDVELFAVATGPGSFNGIRGGIATAEGLALALGRPAVGVPTLDAIAYAHAGRAPALLAVLPAGRGDYYTASYAIDDGTLSYWTRRGAYTVGPLAGALADLPSGALVCGSVAPADDALVERQGLRRAPRFAELPRALALGALAVERAGRGELERARSLTPLYLRRPGITQSRRAAVSIESAARGGEQVGN